MKKLLILFLGGICLTSINAQENATSNYQNGQGWGSIQIDYIHHSVGISGNYFPNIEINEEVPVDLGKSTSLNGLSIAFNRSFGLSKSIPLYLEAGISIQASFGGSIYHKENQERIDYLWNGEKYYNTQKSFQIKDGKFLALSVPVKILYQIRLPKHIAIEPFLGVYIRENILGESKMKSEIINTTADVSGKSIDQKPILENIQTSVERTTEKDGFDMFKTETMSQVNDLISIFNNSEREYFLVDNNGNRQVKGFRSFQVGGMIGANLVLNNKYYLNASYGFDFNTNHSPMTIYKTIKEPNKSDKNYESGKLKSNRVKSFSLGLGIRF